MAVKKSVIIEPKIQYIFPVTLWDSRIFSYWYSN